VEDAIEKAKNDRKVTTIKEKEGIIGRETHKKVEILKTSKQ